MRKHTISFKNAWNGLRWAFISQPNFKIHFFLSILSIVSGLLLHISVDEFLVILLLICMGLTIETVNTAIEQTTDAIDQAWREDIGIAKDISAGAMLIFSLGASIIACVIFIPKIIQLFIF